MKLYIMQHGDAVPKEENAERPLSNDGQHDIEHLAEYLSIKGVQISHILHSGKLRAEQSAELMAAKFPSLEPSIVDNINPIDDPKQFIESLDSYSGDVLIVSHMPFVSSLCSRLLSASNWSAFNFKPGSITCLQRSSDGYWSMDWMLTPDEI